MRSRVTENCWPTSSSVWSVFMPMPKRMRSTRSSRGVSEASTRVVVSRRFDWLAASIWGTAFLSSMRSPRCESSSSPIGVSSEIGSLAIFKPLRTFSMGMWSFSASSSGVGSRPISWSICRLVRTILLITVHGDADGARLIGERAADRLPDPPRRVGRELVAAAVLELVDRLHQADVALLDQIEELQAAVGVFLRDRDDEAEIGLHHLLLGLARLALALLHHMDDLAELQDLKAGLARQLVDVGAQVLDAIFVAGNEVLPAPGGELGDAVEPTRIELRADVVLEEVLAHDAVAFGKPHHAALIADQALVDVVELLDQGIDARLIEPQQFHLGNDFVPELLVFALLGGRQ